MSIEARDRERNPSAKAIRGLNYKTKIWLRKEREIDRDRYGNVGITYCRGGENQKIGRIGKNWDQD